MDKIALDGWCGDCLDSLLMDGETRLLLVRRFEGIEPCDHCGDRGVNPPREARFAAYVAKSE